jgi:hypothetical protein
MATPVYFSDPTKFSSALSIEDGKLEVDQTSITLIGKNASSYSQAINTNFVHLLENHASATPPNNPIEGQLWFDTSDPTSKKLRVNDSTAGGANWKPINGLYQQDTAPEGAASGDIWIDTARAQLSLTLDGNTWILVGPTYSSLLKTGSYADQITDIFGTTHNIIKNFVDNAVVEIITATAFTPQQKIEGFETLKAGVNLTSVNSAIFNATAFAAQNLLVTSPTRSYINGNNFLRNDIDSSINGTLNVRTGLTIGSDPSFQIKKQGTFNNAIVSAVDGSRVVFQILNNKNYNNILTIYGGDADQFGGNKKVTVGNPNSVPAVAVDLDVNGSVNIAENLNLTSTSSVLTINGSAVFGKAISLSSTSSFSSTATFQDTIVIGKTSDSTLLNPKTIIQPLTNAKYNIGTSSTQFARVFAAEFVGNLTGTSSQAGRLVSTATFTITGDVAAVGAGGTVGILGQGFSYNGTGGTNNFQTILQTSAISGRNAITASADDDEILVAVKPAFYFARATTSSRGSGATFNVYRTDGAYVINGTFGTGIEDAGLGYVIGTVLTISGADLGGSSPTNNITIKVTGINGVTGAITGYEANAGSDNWGVAVSGLNKITKRQFLREINYQGTSAPGGVGSLVPSGTIISFAGPNPPSGWLLCDGSIVTKNEYPYLYTAIGYTYGATSLTNQFKLPDLRGRMLIGFDNMTNNFSSSPGKAFRVEEADSPPSSAYVNSVGGIVSGGSAFSTAAPANTPGFGGTSTGIVSYVMNPFLAINYIIKT